jgi:nondiscriminating glutamyl-tRNA synthetase
MPSRAMVTGQLHGPDMADVFMVMGKAGIQKRLTYVKENFTK